MADLLADGTDTQSQRVGAVAFAPNCSVNDMISSLCLPELIFDFTHPTGTADTLSPFGSAAAGAVDILILKRLSAL